VPSRKRTESSASRSPICALSAIRCVPIIYCFDTNNRPFALSNCFTTRALHLSLIFLLASGVRTAPAEQQENPHDQLFRENAVVAFAVAGGEARAAPLFGNSVAQESAAELGGGPRVRVRSPNAAASGTVPRRPPVFGVGNDRAGQVLRWRTRVASRHVFVRRIVVRRTRTDGSLLLVLRRRGRQRIPREGPVRVGRHRNLLQNLRLEPRGFRVEINERQGTRRRREERSMSRRRSCCDSPGPSGQHDYSLLTFRCVCSLPFSHTLTA